MAYEVQSGAITRFETERPCPRCGFPTRKLVQVRVPDLKELEYAYNEVCQHCVWELKQKSA
ncbi:MAG: hypothetical protein KGJ13_08130 [Patescibacteria group bacterium]|nr:hypothetical protein [Patescibacteria group bacterium]